MSDRKNVLSVENATMQFGGVVAVNNLTMEINEGEIVALIGPNGAGKTTAFNVITGVYAPTNGRVWFNGEKIVENHPHGKMKKMYKGECADYYHETIEPTPDKITARGMARTFQNIRLFKSETVYNNVLTACHADANYNIFQSLWRWKIGPKWLTKYYHQEKELNKKTEELLKIMGIWQYKDMVAANLPYGQQRKLEIARALAANPTLLLLDEPAAGLDPRGRAAIFGNIVDYQRKSGKTVVIVSHSMEDMAKYCDDLVVMYEGKVLLCGECNEVFSHSDKLFEVGLDIPWATKLLIALKAKGFDVDCGAYTVEDALREIKKVYKK